MNDVLNPVDLEKQIIEVKNICHRGVTLYTEKHKAYLAAETAWQYKFSVTFLEHDGPQTEKRHAAEVAAHELREARDQALVELKYVEKKFETYQGELAALQNLNKGVRAMYLAERGLGG